MGFKSLTRAVEIAPHTLPLTSFSMVFLIKDLNRFNMSPLNPPEKCKFETCTLEVQAGNDKDVKTPVLLEMPKVPLKAEPLPMEMSTVPWPCGTWGQTFNL